MVAGSNRADDRRQRVARFLPSVSSHPRSRATAAAGGMRHQRVLIDGQYVSVPDPSPTRYVSICDGAILVDCEYMIDRALIRAEWQMMSPRGLLWEKGAVVIEYEHLPALIRVLQRLQCEIETLGPGRIPVLTG